MSLKSWGAVWQSPEAVGLPAVEAPVLASLRALVLAEPGVPVVAGARELVLGDGGSAKARGPLGALRALRVAPGPRPGQHR
eukprot:5989953-Alexandrium_andersonii.AAC.1